MDRSSLEQADGQLHIAPAPISYRRRKCCTCKCCCWTILLLVVATAVAIAACWPHLSPLGPETAPDTGAWGYNASDRPLVGKGDWCQIAPPAATWKLEDMCASGSGQAAQSVKVLTYNLFWWNLFRQRGGLDGSAGRLIAKSHKDVPFDFMGFQECDDVARVMRDAGLGDSFETIDGQMSIVLAYNRHKWKLISSDRRNVGEDREDQYYGRRNGVWARLQSLSTRRIVLFVNHHGPLPVNTGGKCNSRSVAYHLFRMIGYHGHQGDSVILVGDFNADRNSDTVRILDDQLKSLYTGVSFNGVDHIYGQCVKSNPQTENLGNGGSDHDALAAMIELIF